MLIYAAWMIAIAGFPFFVDLILADPTFDAGFTAFVILLSGLTLTAAFVMLDFFARAVWPPDHAVNLQRSRSRAQSLLQYCPYAILRHRRGAASGTRLALCASADRYQPTISRFEVPCEYAYQGLIILLNYSTIGRCIALID
jgi:hypothetical protein